MRKTNKQLNILISYIENVCRIILLLKLNMNVYVIFLISIWMKQKMNLFYEKYI